MVVDAFICHWATVVAGEDVVPEVLGRALQKLASLFYMDYGLLALPWPSRIQEALDVLTGLFDRVGLWTYVEKTVGMVCQPCSTVGIQSTEAYIWRITGEVCAYH